MRRRLAASVLALALPLVAVAAPPAAAETTLRVATLAPEGSSWMKLFRAWQKTIEARTAGRVKIKIYSGGQAGSEKDAVRKIRLGQLQGAAVTGIGLSAIDVEVRTVEVARTYEQLDALRAKLSAVLRKRFEDKGFVLLGWGDIGPVHLFSKNPINSLDDLRRQKVWLWSDDPISKRLFEALELRGVPMDVPDVLPALSTGAVDTFFGSPLSTLALQWSNYAKYMHSAVLLESIGATVLTKAAFQSLSPEDQKILMEESRTMEQQVLKQVRDDNARSIEAMKRKGLQVVPTPPAFEHDMRRRGERAALEIGKSFSPETRAQMDAIIKQLEAGQK